MTISEVGLGLALRILARITKSDVIGMGVGLMPARDNVSWEAVTGMKRGPWTEPSGTHWRGGWGGLGKGGKNR